MLYHTHKCSLRSVRDWMGGGKRNFNALRNLKKYKLKLCVFQKKKKKSSKEELKH